MRRPASALISSPKQMDFSKPSKFSPRLASHSSSLSLPFLPHPTQLPPRPSSGPKPCRPSNGRLGCFCTAFLLAICFSLYFFSFSRGFQFSTKFNSFKTRGYIIIIDAGSSGSRAHVFSYINDGPLPLVSFSGREGWSLKTKPGLSTYAEEPHNAGQSLAQLLVFASSKVPERERQATRIYLMATAGLRRLDLGIQETILESCRVTLRASGFKFRDEWASVITGTDEGIFAWVAANYALGSLGRSPEDTVGIIELGGASAQVTFVPDMLPPPEFLHTMDLGGVMYPLYSHSFLHLGQEAAWDGIVRLLLSGAKQPSFHSMDGGVIDYCTPRGFVMSSELLARMSATVVDTDHIKVPSVLSAGNFSECRSVAVNFLKMGQDECLYQSCAVGSTFVPELRGKFFATENFFYTSQFFGLLPKATLADIQNAGKHFCEEDWRKIQEKHEGILEEELLKYCFSSAYIVALLHDSLGVAMSDDRVVFTNQVGKISLDWALGALIIKMKEDGFPETSTDMFEDYKTIFSFVSLSLVIGLAVLIFYWWRRPNIKTIYDLEKGRYITTVARNLNKF